MILEKRDSAVDLQLSPGIYSWQPTNKLNPPVRYQTTGIHFKPFQYHSAKKSIKPQLQVQINQWTNITSFTSNPVILGKLVTTVSPPSFSFTFTVLNRRIYGFGTAIIHQSWRSLVGSLRDIKNMATYVWDARTFSNKNTSTIHVLVQLDSYIMLTYDLISLAILVSLIHKSSWYVICLV
jgi:hypothetical protein